MDRFLIESPHSAGDCQKVVKDVYAEGYLSHCDWGCEVGVHTAWVIIEAENDQQALRVVPYALRKNARAIKLVKFNEETFKKWEANAPAAP